jgi:hypothetical protein
MFIIFLINLYISFREFIHFLDHLIREWKKKKKKFLIKERNKENNCAFFFLLVFFFYFIGFLFSFINGCFYL